MPALAALTGPLPKAGVVLVAMLVAVTLLARPPRPRALASGGALVLAPLLLLADIWSSPQLRVVHRHPLLAVAGLLALIVIVAALAALFAWRPSLLALLSVVALPFRIPIQAGGATSNLLVPLYLVVAGGTLAFIVTALRGEGSAAPERPAGWVRRLLALYVVLYGLQSVYSVDFEKALQQMAFFYVPFALLFGLLSAVRFSARLVGLCLVTVVGLALLFALVGFIEYSTKTILLNPKLVVANDLHTYFTVNSVFFDPDVFGRFLALVMIALAAVLLVQRAAVKLVIPALVVLWGGLVLTLSRSSLAALLLGLATLAAMRWRLSRTLVAVGAVIALGALAVAISPKTFGLNQGLNGASSGRASLITGGVDLFGERPLWGYGSGSFVSEYRRKYPASSQTLSASHAIPVTVAAEQGAIGELAYVALVLAAVLALLRGARADPARTAIAACFIALVFHTLLYADFLEDPVAWALLGVGCALASQRGRSQASGAPTEPSRVAAVPA